MVDVAVVVTEVMAVAVSTVVTETVDLAALDMAMLRMATQEVEALAEFEQALRRIQGTSGILAALPESEWRPSAHGRPMFNQKASSFRMIPAILKPTVERHVPVSAKYHQSAPVNVSVLSKVVRRAHEFNADDSDDEAEGKCCRHTRSWRGVLSSHQYCPA